LLWRYSPRSDWRADSLLDTIESYGTHDLLLTLWWVTALVVLVIAIGALIW
jgi:hypothetical protein